MPSPSPCAYRHRASTTSRAITADTALRLARYFSTSAEFWLGLQSDYEMKIALAEHGARINRDVSPMEQAA
jgi:plasmid maintenance system antidote protein VapI